MHSVMGRVWKRVTEQQHAFRVGLEDARVGLLPATCGVTVSAGVVGDGKQSSATFRPEVFVFSWELGGSRASLLGTGVTLEGCLALGSVFVRVDSLKQGDESAARATGLGVERDEALADLEKN